MAGINEWNKFLPIFQGIKLISGIPCLVKLTANEFMHTYNLHLMTQFSENFFLPIYIDEPIPNIATHIIKHLYFTYIEMDLKLNYDVRNGTEFLTLLGEIRGMGMN